MGFFKDFKRDFAQAVNELMPDKNELSGEYDDEDMVNTFDGDDMDIAPEDMLENLDDIAIDENKNYDTFKSASEEAEYDEEIAHSEEEEEEVEAFSDIPQAEIIAEDNDFDVNTFDTPNQEMENIQEAINASYETDTVMADESVFKGEASEEASDEKQETDELAELDKLEEENMTENLLDALAVENENDLDNTDLDSVVDVNVNLAQDVSDAYQKREETEEEELHGENDDWEDSMAEIDKIREEEKETNVESILTDDTTYITKGTVINGNIETEGGIDIIGTVNGDVTCIGKLILGGTIKGNVSAGQIYANAAKIEGEVSCDGSVKIGVGSVIVGNIIATSAVIAGAVNGDIDVQGPVIVDSTAVIMGNIKSRTVQINNGAVIEGFCSQCYSEIDVKSFFE